MAANRPSAVLGSVAAVLLATGCTGLPVDAGRSATGSLLSARVSPTLAMTAARAARGEDDAAVARDIAGWLSVPLTVDAAVRVALLRNPTLQARFGALGLSAADVFEAGRLRNPSVDATFLLPRGDGVGNKSSVGVTLGFTDLLLRRSASRIAASAQAKTQAEVAGAVLHLVSDTQRAWVDAVAASQRVAVRKAVVDVTSVTAELAARYQEAGNISRLDLQVQQAAATEAQLALDRARAESVDARAALQSLLGLEGGSSFQLPQGLPAPDSLPELDFAVLRESARAERLDVVAARREVEALEQRLRVTRRTRLLGASDVGLGMEREGDGSRRVGPRLSLELPLFQQGQGRIARDEALLVQARAGLRAAELAVDVELQQYLERGRIARDAADRYRHALIPQREAIVDQMQQRTNQMLADSFALLLAKQQAHGAYDGYVDSVQEYWRVRVALLRASGTQLVAALPAVAEERQ